MQNFGRPDPEKAFKHWDAVVDILLQVGDVVMTPERLVAVMMYASLHGSTKDTYYNAFMWLNDSLTRCTSTFDVATVRAAAVRAVNAENSRLKKPPPASPPLRLLFLGLQPLLVPVVLVPSVAPIPLVLVDRSSFYCSYRNKTLQTPYTCLGSVLSSPD